VIATDTSTQPGVLVVGACQAGVQLVSSLRSLGWTEAITLVDSEPYIPYQRPPLSKKALREGLQANDLALRSEQFFVEQGIDLVLGERIVSVTKKHDGSGAAHTASGSALPFQRLALTVGAEPRQLDLPGADLPGIFYLRTVDDAEQLRSTLVRSPRVVIIGGGFVGLEVAATARQLDCEVTVVLADDRLMARAVGPFMSDLFESAHARAGVEILTSTRPVRYVGGDSGLVTGVEIDGGRVLTADVVVVGIGAQPRLQLAQQLGLTTDNGIVVDECGLASDGVTVAAGDCTSWPIGPGSRMRFESVNAATEQAKVVAATIVGKHTPWTNIPWFWSDQYNLKLQAAGTIPEGGTTVVRKGADRYETTILHYAGTKLAAVECVNRPADFAAAKSALNSRQTIAADRAGDASIPLRSAIVGHPSKFVETGRTEVAVEGAVIA
jgi:3-phenylpropionate/trans-cinnamate dioxygenase ferredoxin reductase subunit